MKFIRRTNYDGDVFDNLAEAKAFMLPDVSEEAKKEFEEDFIGENFDEYWNDYLDYYLAIKSAESLEELAEVWNSRTDTFADGSSFEVVVLK
ncbi:MAG: hypothetical protein IIT46_00560 [Lachnospiraceae bacterium]|nr:hypothetical protein [Lachnospiraceae bacterium]